MNEGKNVRKFPLLWKHLVNTNTAARFLHSTGPVPVEPSGLSSREGCSRAGTNTGPLLRFPGPAACIATSRVPVTREVLQHTGTALTTNRKVEIRVSSRGRTLRVTCVYPGQLHPWYKRDKVN